MVKKIICVLCVATLILGLTACTKERDPAMDETYPEYIDDYEAPTPPAPLEPVEDNE